jgi:hypothetical protein
VRRNKGIGIVRVVLGALAAAALGAAHSQFWSAEAKPGDDDRPQAEFHMARLIYNDRYGSFRAFRPWWAIDYPEAEFHFLNGVRRLTRIDPAPDSHHLHATDEALFDHPWLLAQQVGHWSLSDEETAALREYLLRGGFLVVDDFWGTYEWSVFLEAINRVFPNRPVIDIPENDPLLHVLYDLDQRTQIPGRRHVHRSASGQVIVRPAATPPRWRGIYDDQGRLMVAINFNMDMGDAWEHADDPVYPEPMTALAYRFGINYVIYAMTH